MNSYKQVRTQRVARWCNAPTANLDAPSGNLQNIEDKHADQPAKIRATLPYPRVASVEPLCLEKHYF